MKNAVEICKDFLENQYRKRLKIDFDRFDLENKASNKVPVWQWIDAHLNPSGNDNAADKGGLLLDPEIGICLYFLPFIPQETDIAGQIMRALEIRSKLLPEIHYTDTDKNNVDEKGSWRVLIHWLVENKTQFEKDWLPVIAKLRRETAHFEEIPVDAVINKGDDWQTAFERHGLPRLLFNTRSIFRRQDISEVDQWMSADALVLRELKNFPSEFEKSELVILAKEIVGKMENYSQRGTSETSTKSASVNSQPKSLHKLRVKNFRNIANLELKFGDARINSLVLHGPNGTGKSSLFEAISFGLFQTSYRYSKFLFDKDIPSRDRPNQYVESYLRPISPELGDYPTVWINNENVPIQPLAGIEEANKANIEMAGTFLSQETSRDFIEMTSDELGALVLRGYSDLADKLATYVGDNYDRANRVRQDLLRQLGLKANITLIKTALDRIAKQFISSDLPSLSRPLLDWLELAGNIEHADYRKAGELLLQWQAWGDESKKDRLFKEIAGHTKQVEIKLILATWLRQYNQMVEVTKAWTHKLTTDELKPLQKEADKLIEQVKLWGEWLSAQNAQQQANADQKAEKLKGQISQLQKEQQKIIVAGKEYKGRLDHFAQINNFLREDWSKRHPNECPTCGSDLTEKDGILAVVKNLQSKVERDREEEIVRYNKVTANIKEIELKLVTLGQQKCPISAEDQAKLTQSLQWLVPDGQTLSEYIRDQGRRNGLIQQIRTLKLFPSIPNTVEPDIQAERLAEKIAEEFERAEKVFEEPNNWKAIKNKLDEKLGMIVDKHLPSTLGTLWHELAMNLTSAPWLLPGRASFHVKTSRGEQRLSVKLGKDENAPFARYVLNQAEVHIMGLAWFFARHLTYGRFHNACIVMDDPAQEMDQITYRDLCRFWETIVRLHKVQEQPLTLVIMLHQESRALDAARATGGILNVLGLDEYQQPDTLRRIKLLGEGFYPRLPGLDILHTIEENLEEIITS
jgi:hypothetical protein